MLIRRLAIILAWAGTALHLYSILSTINFSNTLSPASQSGMAEDLLVSLVILAAPLGPYLICLLIVRRAANPILVLPAVTGALILDADTYFAVESSVSSTAAINLVLTPIVNLSLILPLGLAVG